MNKTIELGEYDVINSKMDSIIICATVCISRWKYAIKYQKKTGNKKISKINKDDPILKVRFLLPSDYSNGVHRLFFGVMTS